MWGEGGGELVTTQDLALRIYRKYPPFRHLFSPLSLSPFPETPTLGSRFCTGFGRFAVLPAQIVSLYLRLSSVIDLL